MKASTPQVKLIVFPVPVSEDKYTFYPFYLRLSNNISTKSICD